MTNLEDLICEWADAKDISYGEAEKEVRHAIKYFARYYKLKLADATEHINKQSKEKMQEVFNDIDTRFNEARR